MEKNLGRGQRLKSVINDYQKKRPENLQDQLRKISSYEYTNESIERFCDELASNEAESKLFIIVISVVLGSYAPVLSKRIDHHPSGIFNAQSEIMRNYFKEFPSLGSQVSLGFERKSNATCCTGDIAKDGVDENTAKQSHHHVPSKATAHFTKDVTDSFSQSPRKPYRNAKGIGRGQRLRMVAESIPPPGATMGSDIERACGTDYTNQSIERFVKELTEKNESINSEK
ncbi:hypothetical protein J437_LFUL002993 [Ladona fulva]|uniref:Uncharacterized protein n=1 Tax=Ladona fulva TaxID=123851 RepID=A0A8K0JY33_LADFU|nr:hypothetical protein J437_LFUL002993 [Ladona fulva]